MKICYVLAFLCVFGCSSAWANCVLLTNISSLSFKVFASDKPASANEILSLNATLSAMNTEDLLGLLRAQGQTRHYGDLRNALTELGFAAQWKIQNSMGLDQPTQEAHTKSAALARHLILEVCQDSPNENAVAAGSDAGRIGQLAPTGVLKHRQTAQETQSPYGNVSALALLAVFLTTFIAAAKTAHLVLLFLIGLKRRRLTCSIPVHLESMLQPLQGKAVIIGRKGIHVIADPTTTPSISDAFLDGLNCTVKIGPMTFSGRILSNEAGQIGIRFENDLSAKQHKALCALSETPPKYDYSFIWSEIWATKPKVGYGATVVDR